MPLIVSRSENQSGKGLEEPYFKCRYVVVLFGFLSFLLVASMELQFNVSIVAMVNNSALSTPAETSASCPKLMMNFSDENDLTKAKKNMAGEFAWSPKLQGYIIGSLCFGNLIFHIPVGMLCQKFGGKLLMIFSACLIALSTLTVPVVSRLNINGLIVLQVLKGIAQAVTDPATSILAANWFPIMERGLLYPIVLSGFSAGSMAGSVVAGYLCDYFGWSFGFYLSGTLFALHSLCIAIFLYENPKDHPRISQAELQYIIRNQESEISQKHTLPWRQILTSVPVYALTIAMFGRYWTMYHFLSVHPTYLATILHYSIQQSGIFAAAPFLSMFVCSLIAGWLSSFMQKKNFASVDSVRKFWNSLCAVGYTACVLGIYFVGCNASLSVVFGIISMGFSGFDSCGCAIVPNDMSPNFSGTLVAVTTFFAITSGLVIPVLIGYLTDGQQTIEQWNKFMFISAGVVLTSGIIFLVFGSAQVQPWNDISKEKKEKREDIVTRF